MSHLAEQDRFNPKTEFVDIAGNFNNWGNPGLILQDTNEDLIFSGQITAVVGSNLSFKARINGEWLGREEFSGGGPNRTATVTENDTIRFWYNNETPVHLLQAAFISDRVFVDPGSTVQFSNVSKGNPTSYLWNFPGGTPKNSTEAHPLVQYSLPGNYAVSLTVKDSSNSTNTISENVAIRVEPLDTHWWNNAVFYEIFVRSFQDSDGDGIGDFNGIVDRLDYLNDGDLNTNTDLGITAIWLMPIHPSPSYHGYDVTDYRGVHPDYGNLADFKRLITEAHSRGIRVIIDLVLNHSSDEHPFFKESLDTSSPYRSYYRWNENPPNETGPWGQTVWHRRNNSYYYGLFWSGMPDLNLDNAILKQEMFDVANYWLEEVGVDGFRLDAVKFIHEDSTGLENTQATFQFWQDFQAGITQTNPNVLSVGEAWTSTTDVVPYVENEGLNFCFEFDLASSIINSVYHGSATAIKNQTYQAYKAYPFLQFGSFLTNHDMNRIRDVFGNDLQKNILAANLLMTLPGIPFLYYGEEIGMNGIKPDPDIRTPMLWSDEQGAGFTSGTPWRNLNPDYPIKNMELLQKDTTSLWWQYRNSISARKTLSALQVGRYLPVQTSTDSVFSFIRFTNSQTILVVANLGRKVTQSIDLSHLNTSIPTHEKEWRGIGHSASLAVDHKGYFSSTVVTSMEPLSLKMYLLDSVRTKPAGARWIIYPNPSQNRFTIQLTGNGEASIQVYNSLGQLTLEHSDSAQNGRVHVWLDTKPGMYWVSVTALGQTQVLPLVVGW